MAEENDVSVKIGITADKRGGDEVVQTMDRVEQKSKKSAKGISDGFQKAQQAAGRYNNFVRNLTNFSIFTGGLASVLSLWDRITSAASKAKEEAARFAKEEANAADKRRIDDLAESYRKLCDEIARAATERQRANELEDMQTSEADRLEDDKAKLQKAQAIAALDPNDPAYEEKKRKIENGFEVGAAKRTVSRAKRDAETKRRREEAEADAKHVEATKKEYSLIDDRAELARIRRKAQEADIASGARNEFDNHSFMDQYTSDLKRFVTLDWGNMWSDRTEKGDEERKRQAEEAKRYREEAKALEKKIREKEDEIKALDEAGTHHIRRAGVYGTAAENTDVAMDAALVSGQTSTAAADRAVADKEREIAAARALLASGGAQADKYRGAIRANNERIADAAMSGMTGKMSAGGSAAVVSKLQEQNAELQKLLDALLREIERAKQVTTRANQRMRNAQGVDSTEGL